MSHLIHSLLFLARAENPSTQIEKEKLNVAHELSSLAEFYESSAHDAGVELRVSSAPDLTASLDRVLFQRAMGNLISNAIAHTRRGGRIDVSAQEAADGKLAFEVRDTGCGISPEHLPHVFDRFYRVDQTRSMENGHLGLGLSMVKSISNLHGGSIAIGSEVGVGTRVSMILPV